MLKNHACLDVLSAGLVGEICQWLTVHQSKTITESFFSCWEVHIANAALKCTWIPSHSFTFLTSAPFWVHWKSTGCIIQRHKDVDSELHAALCTPAVLPCSRYLLKLELWISMDTTAWIWNGFWCNEDLDPQSCPLYLSTTDAQWNCFKAYWCFVFLSHQSTSSANKCVAEWSYSCLKDENGICWSWRNCMGDKADRPPQLIWKTARFLSHSAFLGNIGSGATPG